MTLPVIDCGVMQAWRSPVEVFEYLPEGWREYVYSHLSRPWRDYLRGVGEPPGGSLSTTLLQLDLGYYNPLGDYLPDSVPKDGSPPASDVEVLRKQHLDPAAVQHALLCHALSAAVVPSHGAVRLSVEFTRALNDLTIERWLPADERLSGTILVPTQVPEAAAAEIRRVGEHPRMAAVHLGVSGLAHPFGHPSYAPIFEAAHELELPIVIQTGADQTVESPAFPAAAGTPATFSEFRVLGAQTLMTHVASLIGQGVMYRYPSLRFLLLGASVAWLTPFLWRFDTDYRAFRHDVMFLKGLPSEVFREYFFVGTFPFNFSAADDRLAGYLKVDHHLEDVICYSSGFPDTEFADPTTVAALLPEAWESKVLYENPLRFLGPRVSAARRTAVGE